MSGKIKKRIIYSLIILLCLFSLAAPGLAQDAGTQDGEDTQEGQTGEQATGTTPAVYTLDQLIEAGMKSNKELWQLKLDYQKDLINLEIAKANQFPKISFQTNLIYIGNPIDPIVVSQGAYGSYVTTDGTVLLPPEDIMIYEGQEPTLYQFTLKIEQPLFTWGKIKNGIELYKMVTEADLINIQRKEKELKTKISSLYYSIYYLEKIKGMISEQKIVTEKLIKIAEDSYNNGFLLYSQLLETRILVKEIDLANFKLLTQEQQLLIDLSNTCMLENLGVESIDFSMIMNEKLFRDFYDMPGDSAQLKGEIPEKNLDLKILDFLTKIAEFKLKIAEGTNYFKPDIGIQLEISYSGSRFPFLETGWFGEDDYNLIFAFAFVTTLFDGGKLKQEIEISKEEREKALLELEKGKDMISKVFDTTLTKIQLNHEKIEYDELKIENEKIQIEQKKVEYETGAGTQIDYLKEQINLYTEWINYYQEYIDLFINYYTLLNIAGKI